jgi:GAF domain/FHA domain
MPARLTVYLADRPARVLSLADEGEYVIGRDPASELWVDDDRVSRRHAWLRWDGEGWELADLGSKNGTYVNGVPAYAGSRLPDQGWLSLGGVLASFERLSERQSRRHSEVQVERWRSTLASRRRLALAGSLDGLVRGLLDAVVELCGAERGFVLLARADGELEVAAASGLGASDLRAAEFSGSIGAVERALQTGLPVATSDASADPALGGRESIARGGIRALVCVPVTALDRRLGAIYADSRRPGSAFTELEVEILEALAAQASVAIGAARLDEEVRRLLADLPARLELPVAAREQLRGEIERAWESWRGHGRIGAGAAAAGAGGGTAAGPAVGDRGTVTDAGAAADGMPAPADGAAPAVAPPPAAVRATAAGPVLPAPSLSAPPFPAPPFPAPSHPAMAQPAPPLGLWSELLAAHGGGTAPGIAQ